jgi:porin
MRYGGVARLLRHLKAVKSRRSRLLPFLPAVAAATAPGPAAADGQQLTGIPYPSIASSLPPALARRGITFGVNYIGEVLGNPSGGFKQGTYYDGRLEIVGEADFEKMIGWKGLIFHTNGYQIHGESISAQDLGVLMPVSFIEATPATRLFEAWFEQKLLDDHLSIRFGQLAADSEFIISQGAAAFINGTWGWPAITAANMPQGGPAYPLATPGVRLAYNPNDDLGILVGLYNGKPAGRCPEDDDPQVCNKHGLDFPINAPPLLMVEGAFRYNQGDGQLPGTVKLGGYHNFGSFEHVRLSEAGVPIDDNNPAAVINGDYGLYAIIDQMIYRIPGKDPKGIAVFGRLIGAPSDRNTIGLYAEGGVTFTGMTRPNDVFGIAYAYSRISGDVAGAALAAGETILPTYESLLEVSYIAQIVPGFTVQPDFQYFWNPGGHVPDPNDPTKDVPNAAVLGLRTTLNY